jgi:hypothetical protein
MKARTRRLAIAISLVALIGAANEIGASSVSASGPSRQGSRDVSIAIATNDIDALRRVHGFAATASWQALFRPVRR